MHIIQSSYSESSYVLLQLIGWTIAFLIVFGITRQMRSGLERVIDCYLIFASYIITMLILGLYFIHATGYNAIGFMSGIATIMLIPAFIMLFDILNQRDKICRGESLLSC
ncbi:MAG: hypothetical protein ACFFEE_04960 [Candidatus Thorarchaeota archaeon]